jgi:hypothetical protein
MVQGHAEPVLVLLDQVQAAGCTAGLPGMLHETQPIAVAAVGGGGPPEQASSFPWIKVKWKWVGFICEDVVHEGSHLYMSLGLNEILLYLHRFQRLV